MSVVKTIKENCRRCYTCVRSCPAKAIKIEEGQAKVIAERCIGCGNCVKVCSQNAKQIRDHIEKTMELVKSGRKVVICLAPSFPAEFPDINYKQLISALKKIGFSGVYEVGFGADLVSDRYKKLLDKNDNKSYIATSCPAVVYYIEKYHPELIDYLIPIVSPMIATAKVIKEEIGSSASVVFVGPCISKKLEAEDENVKGCIDSALTFKELREIVDHSGIDLKNEPEVDFEQPISGMGSVFPISQGILKSANIEADILDTDILATEGKWRFLEAIDLFAKGELKVKLLEVLFCEGCINGPGMNSILTTFKRKAKVSEYVKEKCKNLDYDQWKKNVRKFDSLDLSREYRNDDNRVTPPSEEAIREILKKTNKFTPQDELNCGSCGYDSCREQAIAILNGLAEKEMCLPYLIEELQETCTHLEDTYCKLFETQEQLIQSEKLASMGQLAAGIAHEVNNPLGTVLIYSHILLKELKENTQSKQDLELIVKEATRCKKIISGLLDFSRQSKLIIQKCDIRDLLNDTIMMVKEKAKNIDIIKEFPDNLPLIDIDKEQIKQVFINIITNAIDAMPNGGTLTIDGKLTQDDTKVEIKISDTGCGIPKENIDKIFNPFFTTKQIGKGTGLGLAISYGIIKMHRGDVKVESEVGKGTTFTLALLIAQKQPEFLENFKQNEIKELRVRS